jgi:hypothetical protein
MASYKSGFDPPTRPGEIGRSRRMGQYMAPGQTKEHREADIAHISGQMEVRRPYAPVNRQVQTGLPRPNLRDPSPTARPEVQKPGTGSRFGFGRAASKTIARAEPPELRSKSSRNVLRRKPSSIAQGAESSRPPMDRSVSSSPTKWNTTSAEKRPSIDASLRAAEAYNEIYTRPRARAPPAMETPRIIPELDRYRSIPNQDSRPLAEVPHKLSTQDLPPPTPLLSGTPVYSSSYSHHRYSGYSGSGYSGSPSTRFSESPGPGAYSRDTTPTSMSSMSPGIIAPLKTPSRVRQGSPAVNRPPVTMRGRSGSTANEIDVPIVDPQGLPSLRESLTSSSSNSTVKGEGKSREGKIREGKSQEGSSPEDKKKKKRLSPLPPSPPPRKSSQKFKKNRPEEQESPSKPSQAPAKPVMVSPELSSPEKPRRAPLHIRQKSNPPVRPSREGAPDLQSQLADMAPIIQSNLAGLSFSDRRRSTLPRMTASSPLQTQLPSPAFRRPSAGSPSPIITSPREGTPAPSGLGIVPDLRPPTKLSSSGTRTPSPSVANSKPRFGLFGRRTKTAPEQVPTVRKGPAAGTGHEGYGRYAVRGRSSSAGGLGRGRDRSISAASSSQESFASTRTHDPFLLERMSPVIIAGGGDIVENRNASSEFYRSESSTSISLVAPSSNDSGSVSHNHEVARTHEVAARTTLWPSALPREATKRQSAIAPKRRRPSDSSDDGIGKSSLAFRRSMQRLNNSASALHLPRPLNISKITGPGSMTSLDASIMSDESQADMQIELGTGRKGVITKPKKLEKRPKSPRKWNFFHRSQPKPQAPTALQVTVGKSAPKSIPHYALLDSSDEQQDPLDMPDLEDILRDADVISLSNEELDLLQFGEVREEVEVEPEMEKPEENPPVIFTSPAPMTPEPPTDFHLVKETAPTRPSRLPQVGRIPKVISARPQATSPKSFSRPFARLSTIQPIQGPISSIDKDSVAVGPSPEKPSTPEPFLGLRKDDRQSSADSKTDSTAASHKDFLAFSPRKNSEATTSSSGGLSFAGTTAVIPDPNAALEEDEVWDEYDDLIETNDNDDTIKVPTSATSSHGGPFQYESYESRRMRKSKIQPPKESPTLLQPPLIMEPASSVERRSAMTSSSTYSADMSARMKDLLTTVQTPTTPMSFSDFFSAYGERNNSTPRKPRNSSNLSPKPQRDSSSSRHSGVSSAIAKFGEPEDRDRERERVVESPISQVNLRVGSMTVSKWLTFGHVLFSPAREDIIASSFYSSSKTHSILVIDGLGNGMCPHLTTSS